MMDQNGMYAQEYDENGYMEQEEEWEREGLLDPAWEKQQKKVGRKFIVAFLFLAPDSIAVQENFNPLLQSLTFYIDPFELSSSSAFRLICISDDFSFFSLSFLKRDGK